MLRNIVTALSLNNLSTYETSGIANKAPLSNTTGVNTALSSKISSIDILLRFDIRKVGSGIITVFLLLGG
jgi:hypothetical protein